MSHQSRASITPLWSLGNCGVEIALVWCKSGVQNKEMNIGKLTKLPIVPIATLLLRTRLAATTVESVAELCAKSAQGKRSRFPISGSFSLFEFAMSVSLNASHKTHLLYIIQNKHNISSPVLSPASHVDCFGVSCLFFCCNCFELPMGQ